MKSFLDYASARYYAGNPVISDDEFDKLAQEYNYERVGTPVDLTRAIPHMYPMYSLQKCYVGEKRIELSGEIVETPKLDGAAVSLLFIKGKLVLALTRGDGKAGLDITDKMQQLLPDEIDITKPIQITGEVVAKKSVPNSRNYASGALGLKSVSDFRTRDLKFIAYGVSPYMTDTFYEDMGVLDLWGIDTITSDDIDFDEYPQDGAVFRVNNNKLFESLGYTSKHPRGAYALKEQKEGIVTTLKDVIWQVGRSGVVAPVAILEPIMIEDALVSKATLHNIAFIREKNLELDCKVEIIRSGEIIPKVLRRVD